MTQSFGVTQEFYWMQPHVLSCFPKKIRRTEEGAGGGGGGTSHFLRGKALATRLHCMQEGNKLNTF